MRKKWDLVCRHFKYKHVKGKLDVEPKHNQNIQINKYSIPAVKTGSRNVFMATQDHSSTCHTQEIVRLDTIVNAKHVR